MSIIIDKIFMNYVYKITNKVNQKVYIGKTGKTIEERFNDHIYASKDEKEQGRPIYRAFNKYGIENFTIEEIECVETDEIASEREIYWIEHYNSYIGFKDCKGYNATLGGDGTASLNVNEDEIVEEYKNCKSAYAVAEKFQVSKATVYRILKKHNIYIKYEKEIAMIKGNKILRKFKSQSEANIYLHRDPKSRSIGNALKNRQTTAYGYQWKYIEKLEATD